MSRRGSAGRASDLEFACASDSRSSAWSPSSSSTVARHPQARWGIKPLVIGLAGVFGFDLFLYADGMLFGRLDGDVWVARGVANALVIPFIAIATVRNTGWTIDMHLSRGVVLPVDGAARLRGLSARDRRRRLPACATSAATGARRCRSSSLFAARRVRRAGADLGALPLARSRCSSASTSSRTATTTARSGCASPARCPRRTRCCGRRSARSWRSPTWSRAPAGRSGSAASARAFGPAARLNMRADRPRAEPRDASLPRVPRRAPAGSSTVPDVRARARRAIRASRCRRGSRDRPDAWLVVPLDRRRPTSSASSCSPTRARRSRSTGRCATCSRPRAGRRRATSARSARHRGAARGAQVRRLQPHVGIRRARPQEPRRAAVADAEERRAPPRQSGVPARHAGDGRARRVDG